MTKKASELEEGDAIRMEIGGETVEGKISGLQTADDGEVTIDIETEDGGFYRQDLEPDQEVEVPS